MRTIFCLIFLLFCAGAASASESNGGVTVKIFSASEMEDERCYYDGTGGCYSKYWDISPEDMFEIGSKLYPYLREKLPKKIQEIPIITAAYFNVDLLGYKQQYFGFYDKKNGEKNIHINFFCVSDEYNDDINHLEIVDGGGDCYFNLNYDVKKKKFYGLQINALY